MTKKPENHNHLDNLVKVYRVADFTLENFDPEATDEEKALFLMRKLRSWRMLFDMSDREDDLLIEPEGAIRGMKSEIFKIIERGEKLGLFEGTSIIETIEKDRKSTAILDEVDQIIKKLDAVVGRSRISIDSSLITGGLHIPAKFNSQELQSTLLGYPKKVRNKLKELGISAFMYNSQVSEDEVRQLLAGNE